MNFIIPLAGLGTRFPLLIWKAPKPLIQINGKSILEYSIRSLPISKSDSVLFILRSDEFTERLKSEIYKICKNINFTVTVLPTETRGQAETVYLGTLDVQEDEEILVHNGDSALNLSEISLESKCDGLIITFFSQEPRWSYASCNEEGIVENVEEKIVISTHASTGTYYFSSLRLFRECYSNYLRLDYKTSEIYVAPIYNQMIEMGLQVNVQQCEAFFCLGTPLDIEENLSRLEKDWKPNW